MDQPRVVTVETESESVPAEGGGFHYRERYRVIDVETKEPLSEWTDWNDYGIYERIGVDHEHHAE